MSMNCRNCGTTIMEDDTDLCPPCERAEMRDAVGPINLVPVPMERLLAALGWSGGTVEQVVAEVGRLKRAEEESWTESEGETEHDEAEDPSAPWHCPECFCVWPQDVSRCQTCGYQPFGQGVAALLPEHGEAKS